MKKKDRVYFIINKLEQLYPETPSPLKHANLFELLVAVLLSAQCTDERVNKVTPELFSLANNPFSMLNLGKDQVQKIIRPCGLSPQKSKAIIELSDILIKTHNGEIPNNEKDLEALPGVGHKTASVVLSQGFGFQTFPVDTHIHRLAQRWGLTNGKNVRQTESDLKKLFPKSRWNKLHLQIIFFGREYCTARGCDGRICEICKTCYPKRKKPFICKK